MTSRILYCIGLLSFVIVSCRSQEDQNEINPRESISDSLMISRNFRFSENAPLVRANVYTHCYAMTEENRGINEITQKNYPVLEECSQKEDLPGKTRYCPYIFYYASPEDLQKIEMVDLEENKPLYTIHGLYYETQDRSGILPLQLLVRFRPEQFARENGNADPEIFMEQEYGGVFRQTEQDLFTLEFGYQPAGFMIHAWDNLSTKEWVSSVWLNEINCRNAYIQD